MTRALVLALLLAGAALADPPFPYPDRTFTVGEVLRLTTRALGLNVLVRDSVPKDKRLETTFRNMTCRQALDLVLALEDLEMSEFRPGLYVIARASGVKPSIEAPPPAPSNRRPVVLPLSFIGREELDAALAALGRRYDLAYLPSRRAVAVHGTPDQVEELRRLIAELDVAPESVTIGVASANRTLERGRIRSTGAQDGVLWVTALSGAPARIAIQQIFNVAFNPQAVLEVPVGLSLEVLPRVQGRAVLVEVSLVDASPNRISDAGVDRSQRAVLTTALVPRGGSITIGGMATALRDRFSLRTGNLTMTLFVK